MKVGSKSRDWSSTETGKLVKSFALGAVGAVLAYAVQFVSGQDFGAAAPAITGLLTVLANAVKMFALDTRKDVR